MSPEQEASIRAQILAAQEMAAYFERKGANFDGADDPSWVFDKAKERMAEVEQLQRRLVAAGLPREPDRGRWHFKMF